MHRETGEYAEAEQAYRYSLAIKSQRGNRVGESASLLELGNLYLEWKRPEQAMSFYRLAVDIAAETGDNYKEGKYRNNLAQTLIQLERYDEARPELQRAIASKQTFGHATQSWKTWMILHNLEQASGNHAAARAARQQAVAAYLAYRRDGGEDYSDTGRHFATISESLNGAGKVSRWLLRSVLRLGLLLRAKKMNYEYEAEMRWLLEGLQ